MGSAQVEGVDTRRVIAKLHALAIDPVNRPFIARDAGCIHNIVKTFGYPAGGWPCREAVRAVGHGLAVGWRVRRGRPAPLRPLPAIHGPLRGAAGRGNYGLPGAPNSPITRWQTAVFLLGGMVWVLFGGRMHGRKQEGEEEELGILVGRAHHAGDEAFGASMPSDHLFLFCSAPAPSCP